MSSRMWKLANVSVRGSAHQKTRLPCQDWSALRVLGPERNVVVCALSDGASSARFAHEAAHLVTEGALNYFVRDLSKQSDPLKAIANYDRTDGKLMIQEQQRLLVQASDERGAPLNDYSATLLVAILHPDVSVFLQVGDGCWSVARSGVLGAVTWPTQGEFVGQTDMVTSPNAARRIRPFSGRSPRRSASRWTPRHFRPAFTNFSNPTASARGPTTTRASSWWCTMDDIFDESGAAHRVGAQMASGGQGSIYRLRDTESLCVKLYHERPNGRQMQRIKLLRARESALARVAAMP